MWFGTSQSRKAIHMEMQKQMFGKQMFAGPSLTMGRREDFVQVGLTEVLPAPHT